LSTSADIETHPLRLQSIARWTDLPDLVTANQGEAGIVEVCDLLTERGAGIEAGLLHLDDVDRFAYSGLAERCVRVLLERGTRIPSRPSRTPPRWSTLSQTLG